MTPLETFYAVYFAVLCAIALALFAATGSGLMFGCALLFLSASLWWCIVPPVGDE